MPLMPAHRGISPIAIHLSGQMGRTDGKTEIQFSGKIDCIFAQNEIRVYIHLKGGGR